MRESVFLIRPWKRNELYQRTNSTKHKNKTRFFERWGGKEPSSENQFDWPKKKVEKLFEIFLKFQPPPRETPKSPLIIKMPFKTFLKMTKSKFSTSESKIVNALKNSLKSIETSALPSSPSTSPYPTPFFLYQLSNERREVVFQWIFYQKRRISWNCNSRLK